MFTRAKKCYGFIDGKNQSSGFTLVEVALSILVLSVGLLGVFALFPVGLDAGNRAVNDAQMSAFAEDVLMHFRTKVHEGANPSGETYKGGLEANKGDTGIRFDPGSLNYVQSGAGSYYLFTANLRISSQGDLYDAVLILSPDRATGLTTSRRSVFTTSAFQNP